MNKMIGYIFHSLQSSEEAVKNIRKSLKRQSTFNHQIILFTYAITTYAIMAEIRNQKQNQRIEELSKEIEELKHLEGD